MSAPTAAVEEPSMPMPTATRVTPASAPNLNLWSRMAWKPFSVRMMKTISDTLPPIWKPMLPEPMPKKPG